MARRPIRAGSYCFCNVSPAHADVGVTRAMPQPEERHNPPTPAGTGVRLSSDAALSCYSSAMATAFGRRSVNEAGGVDCTSGSRKGQQEGQ